MSQGQPFIWKSSLGGPVNWVARVSWDFQSRSNNVSQIDGISDVETACWLCGGLEKQQWLLLALIPDTLVLPFIPLVPFKLLP